MTTSPPLPRTASVAALGERLAVLRLCEAPALDAMRRSLERHGQLTPIVAFVEGDQLETLDGLKRLRAARALGWPTVAIKDRAQDRRGSQSRDGLVYWPFGPLAAPSC